MLIKFVVNSILFFACYNSIFAQYSEPDHLLRAKRDSFQRIDSGQESVIVGLISLAQTIAHKSHGVENAEVRALLAKEAYDLNKAAEGNFYDSYIGEALYTAVAGLKPNFNLITNPTEAKNISPLEVLKNLKTLAKSPTNSLLSTSDNKYLYSCNGRNILCWENKYPPQAPQIAYQSSKESISNLLIIKDKTLARATVNGEIEIFSLRANQLSLDTIIKPHNGTAITNMVVRGKFIISIGTDGKLFSTSIHNYTSSFLAELRFKNGLLDVGITPDGKYLLCVFAHTNQLHLINLEDNATEVESLKDAFSTSAIDGDSIKITALAHSLNGTYLAVGYSNGAIRIWNLRDYNIFENKPELLLFHQQKINDLVFSNNSQQLAAASGDSSISLWQIDTSVSAKVFRGYGDSFESNPYRDYRYAPIRFKNLPSASSSLAFSHDNKRLFAGNQNGEVQIFETDMAAYTTQICNLVDKSLGEKVWGKYLGISLEEILKMYDIFPRVLNQEKRDPFSTCGGGKPSID